MARSRLLDATNQCLLLGVKRTLVGGAAMSANDPKADMGGLGLLPRKLTPEPHFAGRNSLM